MGQCLPPTKRPVFCFEIFSGCRMILLLGVDVFVWRQAWLWWEQWKHKKTLPVFLNLCVGIQRMLFLSIDQAKYLQRYSSSKVRHEVEINQTYPKVFYHLKKLQVDKTECIKHLLEITSADQRAPSDEPRHGRRWEDWVGSLKRGWRIF